MKPKPVPDLSRSEINHLIDEWIFSERDRMIVKRRMLDWIRFEHLAEEFDMSPQGIKKIVYRSLDKIYHHL